MEKQIQSLLTDPRILDQDYLFFDNNPFKAPPLDIKIIQDLNTGRAFTQTYAKLITKQGRQILLPVIFYIDGANTGHFVDLALTAVKFTFGIFTRKAREKEHMWRTLGYIPAFSTTVSQGKKQIQETDHLEKDAMCGHMSDAEIPENAEEDVQKTQDLHAMLAVIFEQYLKIQDTGFIWDLHYQNNLYKDVEFVLFTPFFKLDTEEAEKICRKCTLRTKRAQNVCRYCECPLDKTDRPYSKSKMKEQAKIQRLCTQNNVQKLKKIGQNRI